MTSTPLLKKNNRSASSTPSISSDLLKNINKKYQNQEKYNNFNNKKDQFLHKSQWLLEIIALKMQIKFNLKYLNQKIIQVLIKLDNSPNGFSFSKSIFIRKKFGQFLNKNGLQMLLEILQKEELKSRLQNKNSYHLQIQILKLIKKASAFSQDKFYLQVNSTPKFHQTIMINLHPYNVRLNAQIYQILSSHCWNSQQAVQKVLQALSIYKKNFNYKTRFQPLIYILICSENIVMMCLTLRFVNMFLASVLNAQKRNSLKNQLLENKFNQVLEMIKQKIADDFYLLQNSTFKKVQQKIFEHKKMSENESTARQFFKMRQGSKINKGLDSFIRSTLKEVQTNFQDMGRSDVYLDQGDKATFNKYKTQALNQIDTFQKIQVLQDAKALQNGFSTDRSSQQYFRRIKTKCLQQDCYTELFQCLQRMQSFGKQEWIKMQELIYNLQITQNQKKGTVKILEQNNKQLIEKLERIQMQQNCSQKEIKTLIQQKSELQNYVEKYDEEQRKKKQQTQMRQKAANLQKERLETDISKLKKQIKDLLDQNKKILKKFNQNNTNSTVLLGGPSPPVMSNSNNGGLPPPPTMSNTGGLAPPPTMSNSGLPPPPTMSNNGLPPPPTMSNTGGLAPPPTMSTSGLSPPPTMNNTGGLAPPPTMNSTSLPPPPTMNNTGGLAPPPTMNNTGLPPPPTMNNTGGLAPPPTMNSTGLPPPPTMSNTGGLAPPPTMNSTGLPPPPIMNNTGGLAPPPMMNSSGLPPPTFGSPPPPIIGGPPPIKGGLPGLGGPPTKQKCKPKVPLKGCTWSTIPYNKIDKTIWKEVNDTKYLQKLDKQQLQKDYYKEQAKQVKKINTIIQPKKQKISLLTGQRAKNIELILGKLRIANSILRQSLYTCDDKYLTLSNLESLSIASPTQAQVETCLAFTGEQDQLGNAQKFIRQIGSVPKFNDRINGLKFTKVYHQMFDDLQQKLNILKNAFQKFRTNKKIHKILQAGLAIGNYLNGTSVRGGAWGFKIESLQKFGDIKSNDNKKNLFYFLLQNVWQEFDKPLITRNELDQYQLSSRFPSSQMNTDLGDIRKGFRSLKNVNLFNQAVGSVNKQDKSDRIEKLYGSLVPQLQKKIQYCSKEIKQVQQCYKDCACFYCQDPKQSSQVFGVKILQVLNFIFKQEALATKYVQKRDLQLAKIQKINTTKQRQIEKPKQKVSFSQIKTQQNKKNNAVMKQILKEPKQQQKKEQCIDSVRASVKAFKFIDELKKKRQSKLQIIRKSHISSFQPKTIGISFLKQ